MAASRQPTTDSKAPATLSVFDRIANFVRGTPSTAAKVKTPTIPAVDEKESPVSAPAQPLSTCSMYLLGRDTNPIKDAIFKLFTPMGRPFISTIGVETTSSTIEDTKFTIGDTAGQSRFQMLSSPMLNKTNVFLICPTDTEDLDQLADKVALNNIHSYTATTVPTAMITDDKAIQLRAEIRYHLKTISVPTPETQEEFLFAATDNISIVERQLKRYSLLLIVLDQVLLKELIELISTYLPTSLAKNPLFLSSPHPNGLFASLEARANNEPRCALQLYLHYQKMTEVTSESREVIAQRKTQNCEKYAAMVIANFATLSPEQQASLRKMALGTPIFAQLPPPKKEEAAPAPSSP